MPRGRKRTAEQPSRPLQLQTARRGRLRPFPPATQVPTQVQTRMNVAPPQRVAGSAGPSSSTTSAPDSPEIDQTMLMDAIQEYARDKTLTSSKEKLGGVVENLLALVCYNKDNPDEAGSVSTRLFGMIFELVEKDFSSEKELYGPYVWHSPKLIGSMKILMVIYLSAISYKKFELSDLIPHLVKFSISLLEQFKIMDLFHLESHVITLAALYLRILYACKCRKEIVGEDFARETVFELLYRYNDDYIWQGNPITFLKELPSSYNLIWITQPEFGNIIDSIARTPTKDHLKALYSDSIVLKKPTLTDKMLLDGSNLDLEYLYTLIADPSREAKKVDRALDIICQVIVCNNHHYTVLFPPREVIEVKILPLLHHEEVYIKVRACHLITVWVKSFIYRYPSGPDKDEILASILHRLFMVTLVDSNLSVQFSISRAIISLLSSSTSRNYLETSDLRGVILKLIETYSKFPFEVSPLLATNLILKQFADLCTTIRIEVFFCLCDILKQTCKKISFCRKYNLEPARSVQDEIESVVHTLKGLEVILVSMSGSYPKTGSVEQQCEEELVDSLKFIYVEFLDRNLDVTGAALLTQAALHKIICRRASSIATKQHVTILLNRILEIQDGELKSKLLLAAQSILASFRQCP